jgi:ribosomal protein S18 acetylase RimI-like enzyme
VSDGVDDGATYTKTPFEWTADLRLVDYRDSNEVGMRPASDTDVLIATVAGMFEGSLDAADVAAAEELGPTEAARRLVHAPATWHTSYQAEWWQLVFVEDAVAGFVLPVTYDESDGRVGTIFHMGVLANYRGRGLSRVLLRYTVRTLIDAGVERIFCDTAASNTPMIRAFENEKWTRLAEREVPMPHHFVRDATSE